MHGFSYNLIEASINTATCSGKLLAFPSPFVKLVYGLLLSAVHRSYSQQVAWPRRRRRAAMPLLRLQMPICKGLLKKGSGHVLEVYRSLRRLVQCSTEEKLAQGYRI